MATRMLQRRGTAAEWAALNPVLSNGEIGFETDTKIIRVGDGETAWNDLTLPYVMTGGGTMTGPLSLIAPTQPAHAVRKFDLDFAVEELDSVVADLVSALQDIEESLVVGRWELLDTKTSNDWVDLVVPGVNVGKYYEYLLRITNPRGTAFPTWIGMRLNGQGAASTNMRWKTEEVSSGAWVVSANEDGDNDGAGVIGITGSVANSVVECRMHPAWDKPGNAGIVWLSDTLRSAAPIRRNFAHGRWLTSEALNQVRIGRVTLPNPGTVLAFEADVRYELFGLRGEV